MCGSSDSNPPPPPPPPPPARGHPTSSQQANQSICLQRIHSASNQQHAAELPSATVPAAINEANDAVTRCLQSRPDIHWALVGGACLVALGSTRNTQDVDVVVAPPNLVREARRTLHQDERFRIDPRTLHTHFTASNGRVVDIEFLSSPGTFKSSFNVNTPTLNTSSGVRCLNLTSLLDSKCASMPQRTSQMKRDSDGLDVVFIIRLLISKRQRLRPSDVPNANSEFQAWLSQYVDGSTALFREIGL